MTPEQILQINEQMAKMLDYTIAPRYGGVVCIRTGEEEVSYWQPDKDWNHLIEVYNACKIKYSLLPIKTRNISTADEFIIHAFISNTVNSPLLIEDTYNRLSKFINWYNELPTSGTQSPDRTIPDGRR